MFGRELYGWFWGGVGWLWGGERSLKPSSCSAEDRAAAKRSSPRCGHSPAPALALRRTWTWTWLLACTSPEANVAVQLSAPIREQCF